ncbi:ParA family protein [Luedemannella flava]
MRVVSVINFKGGVGKTTLTSNLGTELARRGLRVLLVDLDPQSSLTFSFYSPDMAAGRLPPDRTLKSWYDSFIKGVPHSQLAECVVEPAAVNDALASPDGFVHLIPSTLHLVNHELSLLSNVGLGGVAADVEMFRLRGALSEALRDPHFAACYDIVLIDCPPNFNIVTQSAIVASDGILVPSRPDYLSTLGIEALFHNVRRLTEMHNHGVKDFAPDRPDLLIAPKALGVVFAMVQFWSGAHRRAPLLHGHDADA